ncbi:MAG: DNA-3-methyladenine glycosylase I [Crocinitomicaceae bacterium]|nr:DNA-3-methyladenine glycosylase I [Crocinitomicaceae bacterium]
MTYCEYCVQPEAAEVHKVYHDQYYGFPIEDDNELFGRLLMEINQAGLSWETILKKEDNFRRAYDNFDVETVAAYGEKDIVRLLSDAGIIRNKRKVNAAIHNAKQILQFRQEFGSFKKWLDIHHPLTKEEWTLLFKKSFKFVGGEIINEFLKSTGYLSGAHEKSCPIFDQISLLNPKWKEV